MPLLWTQKQDIGPAGRLQHAMAYDTARARVVLFGGSRKSPLGQANDTWDWDGEIWTQVSDIGPSPRAGHAMTYDAGRQRLVLFGGTDKAGTYFGDTWEWDGEYWTQVSDIGPGPRYGHAMTYDGSTQRVVLYGGKDGGNAGAPFETWEWDGEAWTLAEHDIGPGFRVRHAMAYDEAHKRVVLFGGEALDAPGGNRDTWARSGGTWARVADTGPESLYGLGMVYDGKRVILFGGEPNAATTSGGDTSSGATW